MFMAYECSTHAEAATRHMKFEVLWHELATSQDTFLWLAHIAVVAIRHHQTPLWIRSIFLIRTVDPVWDIISVSIRCPNQILAHLLIHLRHKCTGMWRASAVVPSFGSISSEILQGFDGFPDVILLLLKGEIMVVHPSIRVRGHIMPALNASFCHFRHLLHGLRHSVQCLDWPSG